MNDRLEDFIKNNKEAFDAHEPNPEVWDKIIINESNTKGKKISFIRIAWRAAAVIAIFVISYFIHDMISNTNKNATQITEDIITDECIVPDDIIEAEAYYVQQVNQKLTELDNYTQDDPDIQAEIEYDFNELDSIYIELKNDLCDNIDNEEVVDAMIQNYRMKLQILEDILMHLRSINQENNETNEYQL
jgi:hypothetical protein